MTNREESTLHRLLRACLPADDCQVPLRTVEDCPALLRAVKVAPSVLDEAGWFRARLVLTEPAPVPVSATVAGLFDALLLIVRLPVRVPDAVGWNVTETVQFPPAAIDVPQVLVCV